MRTALFSLISFFLFASNSLAAPSVHIDEKAWLREGPPNARVLAAFVSMQNTGKKTLVLKGVQGKDFDHIELHKTVVQKGVAKMIHQPKLVIKAGETLTMKPGGYHIMLYKPQKAIKAGDKVTLTLDFGKDGKKNITIPVRKGGMMMHQHHHHHHH